MRPLIFFISLFYSLSIMAQWNWAKNVSINHWDHGKYLEKSSGSIFLGGETGYYGISPSNIFIAKYDLKGNLITSISDTACNLFGFAIDHLENCYALVREKKSMLIKKYDSSGRAAWSKPGNFSCIAIYGNNLYACSPDSLLKYDLNGNYISSIITSNISIQKIRTDFKGSIFLIGQKVFDSYIAKYDSAGVFQWEFYDGGRDDNPAGINDLDFDLMNNIYFTGYFSSQMRTGCDTLTTQNSEYAYFTAKFNPGGQCQWIKARGSRNISVTHTGVFLCAYDTMHAYSQNGNFVSSTPYPLSPYSSSKKSLDAIFLTGIFSGNLRLGNQPLTSSISTDAYIAKFTPNKTTDLRKVEHDAFSTFPNPSYGIFQISLPGRTDRQNVCVYDVLGNCILTKPAIKGGKIDLSEQPKGVYFAEIVENEKKYVTKLVLQ